MSEKRDQLHPEARKRLARAHEALENRSAKGVPVMEPVPDLAATDPDWLRKEVRGLKTDLTATQAKLDEAVGLLGELVAYIYAIGPDAKADAAELTDEARAFLNRLEGEKE